MKSPIHFIATPVDGSRYRHTKNISGTDFITNTSQENHLASNRLATVISTPLGYEGPIDRGDTLLVHHNVFKYYNDMKGRQRSGKSYFMDDLYFIDNEQFFMYKHKGKWYCHDRYCFVKPIQKKNTYIIKNNKEEPLTGKLKYINNYLKKQNLSVGDTVIFQPNSEYEFEVDGEKLYRMFDHQITLRL